MHVKEIPLTLILHSKSMFRQIYYKRPCPQQVADDQFCNYTLHDELLL